MARGLLRFLRLKDWFYFLPLPLLSVDWEAPNPLRILAGIGVAAFGLGFAYGWNNLRDAGMDRSSRKNPLVGSEETGSLLHAVALSALVVLALGAAAWLGPVPMAAAALQLLVGALYSGGIRLKRFPVVGTLTNLGIFCPAAFLCQGPGVWAPGLWSFTGLFGLVLIQNQLLHEDGDRDEDLEAGVRTSAVILGSSATTRLSGLIGLGAGAVVVGIGRDAGMIAAFVVAGLPVILFSLTLLVHPVGDACRRRRMQRGLGILTCGAAWGLFVFGGSSGLLGGS